MAIKKPVLKELKKTLGDMTINYTPSRLVLKQNAVKTGLGLAGIVALHYVPGPQLVVDQIIWAYTAIKAYQTGRDYFND